MDLNHYCELGRTLDSVALLQQFQCYANWEDRYRALIQLGKQLPELPSEWRIDQNRLYGCESTVWLLAEVDSDGVWHFAADSEARIIRGLIAVILSAINHQTAATINGFDLQGYLNELGLGQHLSPSRSNGLSALVEAVQQRVQAG